MENILKILLADDEEIVYQTVSGYLVDLGHYVDKARDPFETLKAMEKKKYDIVILDIRMPGMDGLFLLTKIRQMQPEILVVIITGHGNVDMAVRALKLGAADFLTKPIRLIEIDAVLEKVARIRNYANQNSLYLEELKKIRDELEAKIKTLESRLVNTNKKLQTEIIKHKEIGTALKETKNKEE
jgi:DNA-binding NtrC family response regulator